MYVPADPHEAYACGVKQATEQLYAGNPQMWITTNEANKKLADRRKNLLVEKVTKWANVYEAEPNVSDPAAVRFGTGVLYDSEAAAKINLTWTARGYLGTYPIEIEVPIKGA